MYLSLRVVASRPGRDGCFLGSDGSVHRRFTRTCRMIPTFDTTDERRRSARCVWKGKGRGGVDGGTRGLRAWVGGHKRFGPGVTRDTHSPPPAINAALPRVMRTTDRFRTPPPQTPGHPPPRFRFVFRGGGGFTPAFRRGARSQCGNARGTFVRINKMCVRVCMLPKLWNSRISSARGTPGTRSSFDGPSAIS